jgi:hypothetical protein
MRTVHERMDLLKNSPAPYINHYFGKIFYSIPFVTVSCWNPLGRCAVFESGARSWSMCLL